MTGLEIKAAVVVIGFIDRGHWAIGTLLDGVPSSF